jgi:phosphatidylglycerol---prolipoprotein diacylglyceryl transferase
MRQALFRIPLDSPWCFGPVCVPGFGFGIVLLAWAAFGGVLLYRNRKLLAESPSQLAMPVVAWVILAAGIAMLPWLVNRSAVQELADAKAALDAGKFGSTVYAEAHTRRDRAWRRLQRFDEAIAEYEREIAAHPRFAPAYYRLAWILATAPDDSVRDGRRAVELARRAIDLSKSDPPLALDALAAAHAEAGDFAEAVKVGTQAARFASRSGEEEDGQPGKLVPVRQRLQLYEHERAYRDRYAGRSLPIYGYGFMLFLGFVAGGWSAIRRGRLVGIDKDAIWDVCLWVLVAGVGGARLFYIAEYWDRVFGEATTPGEYFFALINLREGGLVLYGGIILALTAFIVFCLRRKLNPLLMTDVIMPSFFIGLAFGRLGCFMNGCCYGDRCELPWAVSFPLGSVPDMALVGRGLVEYGDPWTLSLHPTQLYSSFNALLLAGLTHCYFYCRRRDGSVLALALLTYPVTRFLIEFLRGDEAGQLHTSLTISQLVSLGMLAAGGLYAFWLSRRPAVVTPLRLPGGAGSETPSDRQ